ncbi:hypothetical protein ACQ4PT_023170 [Festuca glaucescens]
MEGDRIAAVGKEGSTRSAPGPISAVPTAMASSKERKEKEAAVPESSASDGVAAMMGRLKLTAKESKTFVLEDEADSAWGCPEWAIVGKVLAPNTLHIQTIRLVFKPAWGNPKGMKVHPMGLNMFIAVFESVTDMQKVMRGSPWVLGKNAILLKRFDPLVEPTDVVFDRLLLWVRIHGLPFALMNSDRGKPLTEMIGEVDHLEVDEDGRAWGAFLRARINVDITEPLMRCVGVFSARLEKTLYYEVRYENLPMYCFSGGLIGHSAVMCLHPAERDEEDKLPWSSDRVCVPEVKKKERSFSDQGSNSGQGSNSQPPAKEKKNSEVTSPSKPRKPRARKQPVGAGKDAMLAGDNLKAGQKRKQTRYVPKISQPVLLIESGPAASIPQAGVGDSVDNTEESPRSGDSHKRQKNSSTVSTSQSADQAVADEQPRRTQ